MRHEPDIRPLVATTNNTVSNDYYNEHTDSGFGGSETQDNQQLDADKIGQSELSYFRWLDEEAFRGARVEEHFLLDALPGACVDAGEEDMDMTLDGNMH